ncbi:MAG: hypothetical protein ACUVTZ_08955 [Armatimonadota bacterium]
MFGRRRKQDTADKLWSFVDRLRSGRTPDEDAELKELFTVAGIVGSALAADEEKGPEEQARTELIAVIQQDSALRQSAAHTVVRPWWVVLAASGWATAVICMSLLAYSRGVYAGRTAGAREATETRTLVARAVRDVQTMSSKLQQIQMLLTEPSRQGGRTDLGASVANRGGVVSGRPPAKEAGSGPAVDSLVDELGSTELTPQQAQEVASLMRDGYDRVLRGDWEGAVASFNKAAEIAPDQEVALDAYHAAARICRGPLRDPKRAADFGQKELRLARLLLRQGVDHGDGVRTRLARAFETAGLLDGDPSLLAEAARVEAPTNAPPQ